MKPIHGEPPPLLQKLKLESDPPVECVFSIGDGVEYTNDAGLRWPMKIIGFSENDDFYGRFIHLGNVDGTVNGCAWWFPHRPDELRKL